MIVMQAFSRGKAPLVLVRHVYLLWRARILRWRLETFGLYMPSLPSRRPWWRVNRAAFRILLRQRQPYQRWLREMTALQRGGPGAWWRQRVGRAYGPLQQWEASQNDRDAHDAPLLREREAE
jgi:hypothetical protein